MADEADQEPVVRLSDDVTISVERMIRFCHLAELTHELSANDDPEPEDPPLHLTRFGTLMTLTLSFLYSLFEEREDSVNLTRIWLPFDHPFHAELEDFEGRFSPFRSSLRLMRNRYDFHGSLTRAHEAGGFDIYQDRARCRELFALAGEARALFQRMIEWFLALPTHE